MKYIAVILLFASAALLYMSFNSDDLDERYKTVVTKSKTVNTKIEKTVVYKETIETPVETLPLQEEDAIEKIKTDRDEDSDEEDDTPLVEKEKLIGGANVEWEEPKPKDPNNKFGEPPM